MKTKKERLKYVLNSIFLLPFAVLLLMFAVTYILFVIATSPVSIGIWVCTGKNYPNIYFPILFNRWAKVCEEMSENSFFDTGFIGDPF